MVQDLRYAIRSIRKSPGVATIAIVTLALGLGANTAIFSVVQGVILTPLAYDQPDELVFIQTAFPTIGFDEFWISAPEYLQYRDATDTFETMGAFNTTEVSLNGEDTPLRVAAGLATASLFPTLGVRAHLGRTFTPEEDSPVGPRVAVLGYGLWERAFGARATVLGESVSVNGVPVTIVGVMPPRFDLDDNGLEIWLPLAWDEANPPGWGGHNFYAVGRLHDGVTIGQARAELDILMPRWSDQRPDNHTVRADLHEVVLTPLDTRVVGTVRPVLLTLLGAVGFVLLIAVANVGNLQLARAELRQREIAVRTALGAGRGRLLRLFVTESLVLALAAGAVGLAVGTGALRLLLATNPEGIPRQAEIGLDPTVLSFTLGVAILTGVLFGLTPLLHLSRDGIGQGLGDGQGRSTGSAHRARLRSLIVVGEISAAVVLVVGAGLMLRSLSTLLAVDPGFNASGALSFRLFLPQATYPEPRAQVAFFERLRDELQTVPGVDTVSLMSGLPPMRRINANTMEFEGFVPGPDGPPTEVDYWQFIMDDYLDVMRIPLLEGRPFSRQDTADARPVALVNRTMADTYWPAGALGQRLRTCCGDDNPWLTVVGVVGDVKQGGLHVETGTELYVYLPQAAATLGFAPRTMHVVLRSRVPPASLAGPAREAVWTIDPSLPLADVQPLDAAVLRAVARPRFLTTLLGSFGAIALLLAAVGTYGVLSVFVAERTREIGIRMALGAESRRVVRFVLGHGARLAGAGLTVGVAGALLLNRLLSATLFGVGPTDLPTYGTVAGLLATVAVLACLMPARRATRVDPMVVLKG